MYALNVTYTVKVCTVSQFKLYFSLKKIKIEKCIL